MLKDTHLVHHSTTKIQRVVEMLYFLCHHRPNASTLTNEAVLMFVYNKTSDWLQKIELEKLCKAVKQQSQNMQTLYRKREAEIQTITLRRKRGSCTLYRKKDWQQKRRNEFTTSIMDSGLWQREEKVNKMMSECDSDAEWKRAILLQLTFRINILQQHYTWDNQWFPTTTKQVAHQGDAK